MALVERAGLFAPLKPEALAGFVIEFGRERAAADAGAVRLDDAEHEARRRRPGAAARAGRPGDGVGRSDERVGAMIDIEQHALRALEQYPPSAPPGLVEVAPHRPRERQDEVRDFGEVVLEPLTIDRWLVEPGAQRVMVRAQAVEQGIDRVEMGEVADADGAAADLVFVSGSNALAGGADLAGAAAFAQRLARLVDLDVERQYQRARFADEEARPDFNADRLEALNFHQQVARIDHHAITNDARRLVVHDPGWQ